MHVVVTVIKSILWLLLTASFGLLQIWISWGSHSMNSSFPYNPEAIFRDSVLLFFTTALVSALAMDYWFSDKHRWPKPVVGFLFVLYPALIVGLSIWSFMLCSADIADSIPIKTIKDSQYTILSMTVVYSVIAKCLTI